MIWIHIDNVKKVKSPSPFPRPMAHRAAPVSVSIVLGHASANAVRLQREAGPLVAPRVKLYHSILICRAPDERAVSTIFKVFGMTRWGLDPTICWLWGRRSTTGLSLRFVDNVSKCYSVSFSRTNVSDVMYCCCIFSLFYVVCRVNLPLIFYVKIAFMCKVLLCQ